MAGFAVVDVAFFLPCVPNLELKTIFINRTVCWWHCHHFIDKVGSHPVYIVLDEEKKAPLKKCSHNYNETLYCCYIYTLRVQWKSL